MKTSTLFIATIITVTSSTFAFSKKIETKDLEKNYQTFTILDKGVKRTIYLTTEENNKSMMNIATSVSKDIKEGVVIRFKDPSTTSLEDFEEKYGLKLKKKLIIGYYIFENRSSLSDMEIIANILKNEPNIETVKPNWKKRNQPR